MLQGCTKLINTFLNLIRLSFVSGLPKAKAIMEKLNFSADLEKWMSNLPACIKRIPIIYLALPGSHDSGTYTITAKSKIAPDAEKVILNLRWLGVVIRWVMSKWSKTQKSVAREQLMHGVRYFDLRVATKPNDSLHVVHGLYAAAVPDILNEINSFLNEHPREVVILDFQHFFLMGLLNHEQLVEMLYEIFGEKIVPCANYYMEHLSLDYLNEHKYQVLIVYRTKDFAHPFYPARCYPTPWPDTTSGEKLVKILTDNLRRRNNSRGYVSQFILTPTSETIVKHAFVIGNLKRFSAAPLCKKQISWIEEQKPGKNGVNVIIGDFVDIDDYKFCRIVVDLNRKLWTPPESDLEKEAPQTELIGDYDININQNELPPVTA